MGKASGATSGPPSRTKRSTWPPPPSALAAWPPAPGQHRPVGRLVGAVPSRRARSAPARGGQRHRRPGRVWLRRHRGHRPATRPRWQARQPDSTEMLAGDAINAAAGTLMAPITGALSGALPHPSPGHGRWPTTHQTVAGRPRRTNPQRGRRQSGHRRHPGTHLHRPPPRQKRHHRRRHRNHLRNRPQPLPPSRSRKRRRARTHTTNRNIAAQR